MTGRYEGRPQVELLEHPRNVRLLTELVFVDGDDVRWAVPKDAVVNGASIPQILWSLLGGPLDGRYRDASIIHDWFCDRRTRTWQETHRMFYNAMIASGVDVIKAKLLYFGVRWAGPRWEYRTTINTNLASDESFNFAIEGNVFTTEIVEIPSPSKIFDSHHQIALLASVRNFIDNNDISLDQIDRISEANFKRNARASSE